MFFLQSVDAAPAFTRSMQLLPSLACSVCLRSLDAAPPPPPPAHDAISAPQPPLTFGSGSGSRLVLAAPQSTPGQPSPWGWGHGQSQSAPQPTLGRHSADPHLRNSVLRQQSCAIVGPARPLHTIPSIELCPPPYNPLHRTLPTRPLDSPHKAPPYNPLHQTLPTRLLPQDYDDIEIMLFTQTSATSYLL